MIADNKILAAVVKSRKAWELLSENLQLSELGADTAALLSIIAEYYEKDSKAASVDVDIIGSSLGRKFSNPKHVSMLQGVLRNLPEVSPENIASEIISVKLHNIGLKLSGSLLQGEEPQTLLRLMGEYQNLATTIPSTEEVGDEVFERFKVKDLVEKSFDQSQLIPVLPKALNEHLGGGLRPGHHILVFAPTEMGKTLLVINMLAGWVKAKLRVLYIGNEDPVQDLMMRYINRLTLMNKAQVLAHPDAAQELLEKRGYENVIFAPLAPGNFTTIDRLVRRYEPKVVVLDQLRNIDVDSEHRTQALEKAATEGRNLAKRNNLLVVSVSQAADSASGKRILTRGDVDGSNVGIPGQMDLMIGMGGTEEDEKMNVRTLSFPKNKISGDHDSIAITIDPQLSMVVENR